MTRSIAKLSVAVFLFAASAIGAAGAVRADDGKCTIATKPDSPTGKACAKGAAPRRRR